MSQASRGLRMFKGLLAAGLLLVATGAVPFQASQLPVACWPLDEATGTTAADLYVNHPGTWFGNPTPIATGLPNISTNDANSHALHFDGTGNQYVEIPNDPAVLENLQEQSYSMAAWVRPQDVPPGTGSNYNASYGIIIKAGWHEGLKYNNNQSFSLDHWATGNTWCGTGGGTYPPGSWYHVAAVWDRTAGQVRMYVNGTLVSTGAATADNRDYGTNPWRIGIAYQGTADYTWPMKGDIDDARLYNYALNAAQVSVLSNGIPTPTNLQATSALGQVALTWTAPPQAVTYTYSVYASTTPNPTNWGAPIATGLTATNYTHTTGTPNVLTYYTVTATSCATSGYCPPANGTNYTPISVSPPNGIQTNENGATSNIQVIFNLPLPAADSVTITLTSDKPTEGQVSGVGQPQGASITFVAPGPIAAGSKYNITVTGINDDYADGPQIYHINVTTSSGNAMFNNLNIPPVGCTNNDNDTPGVTYSKTTGLLTSESGGIDSFTVVLNSKPNAPVNIPLVCSNVAEATVSPSSLQFTTTDFQNYTPGTGLGGWNVAHTVTVTGVDDAVLDFSQPYTITAGPATSADPQYNLPATLIYGLNLDNEVPPALPTVWGGGCGFLGLELLLPVALASMLRRRRR